MTKETLRIADVPALLFGDDSDSVWLFVHGKCGCKEEGESFAELACPKGWQVLAIDLPEHGERRGEPGFDAWHAVPEVRAAMAYLRRRYAHVALRANSIGAWFSMQALAGAPPEKALFVSPILDMYKLISGMMQITGVDESRLEREGEIATDLGETLSFAYLQYAKTRPIVKWTAPTSILYAGSDTMTDRATVDDFVSAFDCELTVMEDGEHWFHTPEQLQVLRAWESERIPSSAL